MDKDWIEERIWELRREKEVCLFLSSRFAIDVKIAFRVRQWRRYGGRLQVLA